MQQRREGIKRFDFDIHLWNRDTFNLDPALVGTYAQIMVLMFQTEGPVPLDQRTVRFCGYARRPALERAVHALVEQGLVEILADGRLSIPHVAEQIEAIRARIQAIRKGGQAAVEARKSAETPVKPPVKSRETSGKPSVKKDSSKGNQRVSGPSISTSISISNKEREKAPSAPRPQPLEWEVIEGGAQYAWVGSHGKLYLTAEHLERLRQKYAMIPGRLEDDLDGIENQIVREELEGAEEKIKDPEKRRRWYFVRMNQMLDLRAKETAKQVAAAAKLNGSKPVSPLVGRDRPVRKQVF